MNVFSAFSSVGIGETLIHQYYPQFRYTAVEVVPKLAEEYARRFPGCQVLVGDAYEFVYDHCQDFHVICCSPECQTFSRRTGARKRDPILPDDRIFDLIDFLYKHFQGRWWVENVNTPYLRTQYKRGPFLARVERHLFWSNVPLVERARLPPRRFTYCGGHYPDQLKDTQEWLGVTLSKRFRIRGNANPCQVYWEAYHPLTGLDLFQQLLHPVQTTLNPKARGENTHLTALKEEVG